MIPQKHSYPQWFQTVLKTAASKADPHTNDHAKIKFSPHQTKCTQRGDHPSKEMIMQSLHCTEFAMVLDCRFETFD